MTKMNPKRTSIFPEMLHAHHDDSPQYCDVIEQDSAWELSVLIQERKESRPHRGICPRCGEHSKVNALFPYCMDCNWDSLKDPSWSHDE